MTVRPHRPDSAGPFSLQQRCLNIRHTDVEQNAAGVAGAAAHAARDASALGVLNESVVARLRNGLGDASRPEWGSESGRTGPLSPVRPRGLATLAKPA